MKKQLLILPLLLFVFIANYQLSAQETASDLQSLVDMRASNLDYQMENHGYTFIKTEKSGYNSYQNWWNSRRNKCVTVRVSDGKVKSIVNSPAFDCNKSDRDNANNYRNRGNSFYHDSNERNNSNYSSYINRSATSAYGKLEDDGFHEIKTHQEDGNTYKLWYKNRTNECLKTVSRDYKLTKILYSHHCDENNTGYSTRDDRRGNFHQSNSNERNNSNYSSYINKSATSAYRKLQDDGFKELKVFQEDGNTYKLWYKYRTKECLKTVSSDYKLTKILFSHNCDKNL